MNHRLTVYDILRIFFKRKNLILSLFTLAFIGVVLKVAFFPDYEASTVLMLELKKRPTSVERERLPVREEISFIHTNISLLESKPILLEVIKRTSLYPNKKEGEISEKDIKALIDSITIESITFTNLINIKVKRSKPKEAADIANMLVKVFKEWGADFLIEEIDNISEFLDRELVKAKKRLEDSENVLKSFKSMKGVVMSDDITSMKYEDVTPLYKEVAKNSVVLQIDEERLAKLENDLKAQGAKIRGLDASSFRKLCENNDKTMLFKEGFKDIEVKLAYFLKSFTKEHPSAAAFLEQEKSMEDDLRRNIYDMAYLDESVNGSLRPLLEKYLELYSEIMILEVSRDAFQTVIAANEDKKWKVLKDLLPDDEVQLQRLAREVAINEVLYKELTEDKEVIDILKDRRDIGMVKVVSPASVPDKPKGRFTIFVFGNMLGLFLAILVSMTVEYRNHSFKRPREIEENLKLPLLEVFPHTANSNREDDFKVKKGSMASDRFFKLASNITLAVKNDQNKVIQITSSISGEGKTFAVINLAIAAAELGSKVLLIDANFRNPSVHKALGSGLKNGFIDVLENLLPAEVAVRKSALNNLDFITCGEEGMRAVNIFNAEKIRDVLNKFRMKYNLILVDSGAVNPYVDSRVMAGAADGLILLIEADRTQKESVFIAKKTLEEKGKILGVVLNNMHYYIPQSIFDYLTALNIS